MKKKLWIIIALIAALLIGGAALLFGGGNQAEAPAVQQESTEPQVEVNLEDLEYAIEYLRTYYKDTPVETPGDYKRIGTVRVGLQSFTVTWSVDADEAYVKVVTNADGSVTIDVNENSDKEVAYVLTATITDAAGNSLTTTWDHILPGFDIAAMQDIVDQAYALEEGQAMAEAVTLRGIITSIDTPYDSSYKNISVVIAVTGREDKPILCYRLKGEGAETLAVGDTITVTGIIKNYKGTIEFDAGCTLDVVVKGDAAPIVAPEDPAEIMKQAYALANGQSLPYTATLTGTITSVDEAYSAQYNNITVTMLVKDGGGYSIKCYRMKGTGIDTLNVNDIITVTGQIKNYNGTIEFNFPSLDSVTQVAPPKQPSDPKAVVDAAYKLAAYQSLPYEATLTGKVTEIKYRWSEQYPTVSLTIVVEGRENKPLYCYSMTGSLSDMKNVEIGDTVTVRGMIKNYYNNETGESTIEYDHPTMVKLVKNTNVAPSDPKQIVDEAFALDVGEILPYKATLTGKIVTIDTPYDSGYKNITVSIQVEGSDGMKKLKVYRLAGTGAKDLEIGDTITVTGNIKNYNGTIEFDQGCTLDKVVKGDEEKPVAPSDPKQIVDEAFKLASGDSLPYEAQLTGKIVRIDTPYDSGYQNVTVTIEVEGSDGMKELKCYRLKGAGAEGLKVDDVITVKGYITNYNGTVEFTQGCTLVDGSDDPVIPPEVTVTPVAHKDVQEDTAYKFYMEQKTLNKVLYFTGKMSGEYLATSENPAEGTDVYMEKAEDGVRFYYLDGETKTYIEIQLNDAGKPRPKMSTEPTVVYTYDEETGIYVVELGEEKYYYGTYGTWDTISTSSTYYITGDNAANAGVTQYIAQFGIYNGETEEPEKPVEPEVAVTPVNHKDVQEDTAYKFYLEQKNIDKVLYFNGKLAGEYLAVTEKASEGVDVYVEKAEGGVRFYYMDGEAKTYIEIYLNDAGKARPKLSTEPSVVYIFDEETQLYVVSLEDKLYYYGTYSTYETFSTSGTYYITGDNAANAGVSQFIAQFGIYNGGGEEPDVPVIPDVPEVIPGPYLFYLEQNNLQKTFYFNGKMENVYLGTTEVEEEAVEVYMEAAEGGMRLYFLNEEEVKTYIEIYLNDAGKPRHQLVTEPSMVYTYDAETGLYVAELNGTKYYNGTYSTYSTISASSTYYITGDKAADVGVSQFVAKFQKVEKEPVDGDVLTIAEAIALGEAMEHNTYTEIKYTVTGKITEVYNTQYGNMKITDEDGNILTIYGTYSADGEIRYDAMEVKPVAGDTVTVYGIVGQYNGTAQVKNGWITEHVPGEGEEEPEKPADPEPDTELTIAEAVELGKSKAHNTYTSGKYYVTGVVTDLYSTVYGNMHLVDAEGNDLTIYGMFSEDGSERYDAMEVKPVEGDTIKVYGIIGQYNGTPQMKNAWLIQIGEEEEGCAHEDLVHVEAVEPGCHFDGNIEYWICYECELVWQDEALTQLTNTKRVVLPATGEGNVVRVEAKEPTVNEEGNIEHWYCETCDQVWQDEALTQLTNHKNVILPALEICLHENLIHMEAVEPDCHFEGNIEHWYCPDCEIVWQDEALTQITNHKNVIRPTLGGEVKHVDAVAPGCESEGNIEYWHCEVCQKVWQDEALTQLTNYLSVKLPATHQEVVHMEAVEPGCHFEGHMEHWYCADCDMVWTDEGQTEVSNHKNVVIPALGGEVVHVEAKEPTGTEDGNIEHWYCETCEQVWQDEALTQLTNHKNVILPATGETEENDTLTIEEAIALGKSKEHNTYTEEKYFVTGEIVEVYNTQYGNMKIADEDGNILTIYGTWSADGEERYDALEVKPVVGDTVTVYGIIGRYNSDPQMKNGWITEHVPGEVESEDPAADSELTIEEAIALGESKLHNVYTADKYYVTGVIVEVYNTQYGNMKIEDEDGNILTIYGTYSADGGDRYDAMEVKPVEGDTVTVYGVIGQYNGVAQLKNGWITEHEPQEVVSISEEEEEAESADEEETLPEEEITEA